MGIECESLPADIFKIVHVCENLPSRVARLGVNVTWGINAGGGDMATAAALGGSAWCVLGLLQD